MIRKFQRLLFFVVMLVGASASMLFAKVEQKPIYVCGYAVNFLDSTAYITSIQCIDTAYVESKNDFLMDRSQYSSQLHHYLSKTLSGDYICSVLFDKKKNRLEKRVDKVRKHASKVSVLKLQNLSEADFKFVGEQYVESTVSEEVESDNADTQGKLSKHGKKSAGKSAKTGKVDSGKKQKRGK